MDGFLPIQEAASRLFAIVGCYNSLLYVGLVWFVMYLCLLAILAKPELRQTPDLSSAERNRAFLRKLARIGTKLPEFREFRAELTT